MHPRPILALLILACVGLTLIGCGNDGATDGTPGNSVIACAADGTCPTGMKCVSQICAADPGAAADSAALDSGSADAGTADSGVADAGPKDVPTAKDSGAECDPTANVGPTPRGESVGGMIGGKFYVLYGDDGVPQNCNPALKPTNDAWLFDPCTSWEQLSTTGLPDPRARGASAVDTQGGYLYAYGGRYRTASSGPYTIRKDLWRFDANDGKWLKLSEQGPQGRSNTALAFRETDGTLWLFGGNSSNSGLNFGPLGDLWRYDPAGGVWKQISTTGAAPSPRLFHASAITSDGKYLVVFGGGGANAWVGPFYKDTYRLDLETLVWTQLKSGGQVPMGRIKHGMIAVPNDKRLLLFGGHDDGPVGNRNDLWWLDTETGAWERVKKGDLGQNDDPTVINKKSNAFCDFPPDFMKVDKTSPERREAFIWNYDIVTGKIWMFGGKGDCGPLHDVWTLDPKTLEWEVIENTTDGWSCERWQSPCNKLCG